MFISKIIKYISNLVEYIQTVITVSVEWLAPSFGVNSIHFFPHYSNYKYASLLLPPFHQ